MKASVKRVFLIFLCLQQFIAAAQVQNSTQPYFDSLFARQYLVMFNRALAPLATGESDGTNLVNFGTFDPVNGKYKANFSIPIGNPDSAVVKYFSFSSEGKIIGDNVGVLFSNSKFNSDHALTAKLHIPILRFSKNKRAGFVQFDQTQKFIIEQQLYRLQKDSIAQIELIRANADTGNINTQLHKVQNEITLYTLDTTELTQQKQKVKDDLAKVEKQRDSEKFTDSVRKYTIMVIKLSDSLLKLEERRQTLAKEYHYNKHKRDSLQVMWNALTGPGLYAVKDFVANQVPIANKAVAERKKQLLGSLSVNAVKVFWLSPTVSYNRSKIYIFDSSLPFAAQINDSIFSSFTYGLEFNYVKYDTLIKRAFLGTLGLYRVLRTNIDGLTSQTIADSRKDTSAGTTRSFSETYEAYTASEITKYKALYGVLNLYWLFGKRTGHGVHANVEVEIRDSGEIPVSALAGYIFSIKNKKDNAVLNIEPYVKFIDIGRALPQEVKDFYNRNEIGVKFGIPFNFTLRK